jgi:hypothetical protein
MGFYSDVGSYCHWCGDYVPGNKPKTGKHVFCRNGGKCKMAHARAFATYQRHKRGVTPTSGPGSCIEELHVGKRNAKRSDQVATSSADIAGDRAKKSNRKTRR